MTHLLALADPRDLLGRFELQVGQPSLSLVAAPIQMLGVVTQRIGAEFARLTTGVSVEAVSTCDALWALLGLRRRGPIVVQFQASDPDEWQRMDMARSRLSGPNPAVLVVDEAALSDIVARAPHFWSLVGADACAMEAEGDARVEGVSGTLGGEKVAVVLADVPPGFSWGWFSREEPRMHLQTVNNAVKNKYKVWLEREGARVFDVEGAMPGSVESALRAAVDAQRTMIESAWAAFMVDKGWLGLSVDSAGGVLTVTAYPSSNHPFVRQVVLSDLYPALGPVRVSDIRFVADPASVEIGLHRPPARRYHIDLAELLWGEG